MNYQSNDTLIVTTGTNHHSMATKATTTKQWEHGLCGCFDDCSICMLSFFCPCIQVYRNANAIPGGEQGFWFCLGLFNCFGLGTCYNRSNLRNDIRSYKGIKGTHFEDCLFTTICFSLTLAQESMEMKGEYMLRE